MTGDARVTRVLYSLGKLSAVVVVTDPHGEREVPVTLGNLSQSQAISLVGAMGRLLTGAVVMDGEDLLAIRDALDSVRGVAPAVEGLPDAA